VTLTTPVAAINAINLQRCEWLIPVCFRKKCCPDQVAAKAAEKKLCARAEFCRSLR